jgi:DNA-binding CsgD family transcriptional regulator
MITSDKKDSTTTRQARIMELIGDAASAIGTTRFYDALTGLAAARVPHRIAMAYQYWQLGAPTSVAYLGEPIETDSVYEHGYFRFDPFYRYWRQIGRLGVVTLHELLDDSDDHSKYMRAMLFDCGMKDEIAVFLPSLGGSSLGLFMDRADGTFGKSHVNALREIYPTLDGLCRAHQRYVFSKGGVPHADVVYDRPFAIDDAHGHRITANADWLAAESDTPNLNAATGISAKDNQGPVQTNAGYVHSTVLEADFPLAPGGRLHLLEAGAAAPPPLSIGDATKDFFMGELTEREREVLNLILAGNPGPAITRKLAISADTVKKHRRHLYDKLDVTTERELFIRFLDYVFEVL